MDKKNPQISINPLVEYIFAFDRRKQSIVRDQKKPITTIVARYRTSRSAFSKYIINGFDKDILAKAIVRLQEREAITDWQISDKQNSITALHKFLEIEFPFEKLKCTFARTKIKHHILEGVTVIISPDLILTWEGDGKQYIGAVKFQIKKKRMTLQEGCLSASLITNYLETNYPDHIVSHNYCMCVDAMQARIFYPLNYEENISKAEKACMEIADKWTRVA